MDTISNAVLGLLIGDALGVPYEFHPPEALPPPESIEMEPPAGFSRAHPSVLVGTWSDDGAQALCLLASLLHCGRLDVEDFGRRMVDWLDHGYCAVDGVVFDVGFTTSRALSVIRGGAPAATAGPTGERDNGNGALMRVLPLALWHRGDDRALVDDAMAQSRVTHGHLRSQLCCAVYCLWARRVAAGHPAAWDDAKVALRRAVGDTPEVNEELDGPVGLDRAPGGGGTGYVVDCLHSARGALEAGDFEAVARAAVALGHDTDTTAAVACGIAGLTRPIPERWIHALRGRELVEPLLDGLRAR